MKCIFDILTSLKANTTTSLTFTLGVKRDTCYFSKIILYRNVHRQQLGCQLLGKFSLLCQTPTKTRVYSNSKVEVNVSKKRIKIHCLFYKSAICSYLKVLFSS